MVAADAITLLVDTTTNGPSDDRRSKRSAPLERSVAVVFLLQDLRLLAVQQALEWWEPKITHRVGESVMEWWRENRKLTLYMSDDGLEALRSWGTNVHSEMDESRGLTSNDLVPLWRWLLDG